MTGAIKVRVVCPGCGRVVLPAKELRCELEAAGDKASASRDAPSARPWSSYRPDPSP
jgi:hypothetical protein